MLKKTEIPFKPNQVAKNLTNLKIIKCFEQVQEKILSQLTKKRRLKVTKLKEVRVRPGTGNIFPRSRIRNT
jgi:hypothetical protein